MQGNLRVQAVRMSVAGEVQRPFGSEQQQFVGDRLKVDGGENCGQVGAFFKALLETSDRILVLSSRQEVLKVGFSPVM